MGKATDTIDQHDEVTSSLSDATALPAAFIALKQQLEAQTELVDKKSQVIQSQQARIAALEEQLRANKIERYAASSESSPLQARLFNQVEQQANDADKADTEDDCESKESKKPRPKRKELNTNIPPGQQRLLLSDEQREGAIDRYIL